MDRFSISIEAYHELTQVDPNLPRLYLIEGCMKHHDHKTAADGLKRTPGEAPGCRLPIKPLLIAEIRRHVSIHAGSFKKTNVRTRSKKSHCHDKVMNFVLGLGNSTFLI